MQKRGKTSRRVSIHFNGKSATGDKKNGSEPTPSTEVDAESNTATTEEPLTLTPILCRRHHSTSNRKLSQESIGSFMYTPSGCNSKRGRKTMRRHSDSLLPNSQRSQYCHDCGNAKHSHHHHHHHNQSNQSHQAQSSSVSYKERDSFQDAGGTSISERCSNSVASSRESSTSLSQRSTSQQKRKLSITSHSQSGKIPWCGCWGNGCL